MKSIGILLEIGLITAKPGSYFGRHGLKRRGNNLYTILLVGVAMDAFYQRQLWQQDKSVPPCWGPASHFCPQRGQFIGFRGEKRAFDLKLNP